MSHIMLDLETLSTEPNARILAIGAVKFAPDKGVYDKFYQAVVAPNLEPGIDDEGFHISNDTLTWWSKQSPKARAVFTDPNSVQMNVSLKAFTGWATRDDLIENVRMWGNGSSFDNVILASAYRIKNVTRPWKFWNDNCYRTIKNQHPNVHYERVGTHHNALDDAETQAEHLLKMNIRL